MKIYLYCVKSNKKLIDYKSFNPCGRRFQVFRKKELRYFGYSEEEINETSLNGTVCAECEVNRIEEIRKIPIIPADYIEHLRFWWKTDTMPEDILLTRARLTKRQIFEYQPKYALYLENLKAVKAKQITEFKLNWQYDCNDLSRAPQNMCYCTDENDEICAVLSLRPEPLCDILNGTKDIETRKLILREMKKLIVSRPFQIEEAK